MPSIYLGLDLGQAADYSALAVLEEPVYAPLPLSDESANAPRMGWVSGASLTPEQRMLYGQGLWYAWKQQAPGKSPLWLRQLHRYPLRTPYPDIVNDVIRRLGGKDEYRSDAVLVLDATGVGAGIADLFVYADLPCEMVKVIIHGGTTVTVDHGLHVPKVDLIAAAHALWQTKRLQVAQHAPLVSTWLTELENYAFKQSEAGHVSFNARGDSIHDDLVLAVALACWFRGRMNPGE